MYITMYPFPLWMLRYEDDVFKTGFGSTSIASEVMALLHWEINQGCSVGEKVKYWFPKRNLRFTEIHSWKSKLF